MQTSSISRIFGHISYHINTVLQKETDNYSTEFCFHFLDISYPCDLGGHGCKKYLTQTS